MFGVIEGKDPLGRYYVWRLLLLIELLNIIYIV